MSRMLYKMLGTIVLSLVLTLFVTGVDAEVQAQSGLYVPSTKSVRNMHRALTNPEVFYLLIHYEGASETYTVTDLDLLDSAYRIAFDIDNPMYYTMNIEGYGGVDETLTKMRVDAVYRYFAMRSGRKFPVRVAHNAIHCSCNGDTVETLRFEVPTSTAIYNTAELPEARRVLNKSIQLHNSVLVTFRNNPDECVGDARGCFVPEADSIVRGYYASLVLSRGSLYAVAGTKDTCPSDFEIVIEDHLDYKKVVEQYRLVPHRKQLIVQAGYIVVKSNWARGFDSCSLPQKDSIFVRIPATEEQIEAKLKFFAKVKSSRGVEYKQLATRKTGTKLEPMLQAPINVTQFDTIYIGKRIQENELKKYFYSVDGPTEAAAFKVGDGYWVAYRAGKKGAYELKKPLKALFRFIPEQEEESPADKAKDTPNPEEIID